MAFTVPADHLVKVKESKKRDKYLNLARNLKKKKEHESDCNWHARYSHLRIAKGTGGLGNKRTNGDNLDYRIIEIGQNTKKCPGNLQGLTVTQTPLKNHQIRLA